MNNTYQIYLISDSTGETLDRVFLAIKAQFKNIEYDVKSYFFTRTENQVSKIMEEAKKNDNAIILYTIVDTSLAKFLANKGSEKEINEAKKTFTKYKWPIIDVTRKSVEETAASIIKIYEINKNNT